MGTVLWQLAIAPVLSFLELSKKRVATGACFSRLSKMSYVILISRAELSWLADSCPHAFFSSRHGWLFFKLLFVGGCF